MIRINAISFAKMIKALSEDPHTIRELVDHTGLHYVTVRRYMRALHKEKAIHISAWDPDSLGRLAIPVYSWGNKQDAKRRKLSPVERSQRYRLKRRDRNLFRKTECEMTSEMMTLSLD